MKMYFFYGVMGSSKTAIALMKKFNFEEHGKKVLLAKPAIDRKHPRRHWSKWKIRELRVYIQKQLESDLAALKSEKDRLLKRKMETLNKNIEKMKSAVLLFMQTADLKKAKAGTFNLSIGISEKVHVVDENKIPIDFLLKQKPKIDVASLRKFLKSGGTAPGAVLEQTEYVRAR